MLLIVFFFGFIELSAQFNVSVGKQPFSIYLYNNDFYVLCKGVDANFDGKFDAETDEAPSLWRNNPLSMGPISASKIIEFPFGLNSFPVRVLFHNEHLYMQTNGYIWKYDITNGNLLDSIEFQSTVYGLTLKDDFLYVATRIIPPGSWTPENNYIISINLQNKQAIDTIEAKMNVQMCTIYNNALYVLNEGSGAAEDSYVTVYDLDTKQEIKSYKAGINGNYFEIKNDYIYIVSNGSHKVFCYAINDDETCTYDIGTSGWDGPRELVFNHDGTKFRVSAYNGNIYEFKVKNSTPIDQIVTGKKVEGMLWTNYFDTDVFIAALINNPDYTANDYVSVWANPLASAKDLVKSIRIYPNPTTSFVKVENSSNKFDEYEIITMDGKILKSGVLNQNERINLDEISSGTYLMRLKSISGNVAIPIKVVK